MKGQRRKLRELHAVNQLTVALILIRNDKDRGTIVKRHVGDMGTMAVDGR